MHFFEKNVKKPLTLVKLYDKIYTNIYGRVTRAGKEDEMNFLNKVLAAEYDFSAIGQFFKNLYNGSFTGKVEALWDKLWGMAAVIAPFVAYILLALAAIELLFGKRLLGLQKFLGAFALGYAGAYVYLVPVLADLVPALAEYGWIIALVVGVIAILLRKIIYIVVYIAAFAYIPYFIVYSGAIAPLAGFAGNLVVAGAAAGVVVLLALLLRKWVEMLGLSALGAYCVTKVLDVKLGVIDMIPFDGMIVGLAMVGVLTLIGFIIQVKTRKRY